MFVPSGQVSSLIDVGEARLCGVGFDPHMGERAQPNVATL
jgi:hypothetical protein